VPKTKLNFRNLSISAKIAKAKQIVAPLTGNTNFPNPNPALADITAVIMKTEAKLSERDAAQQLAKAKTTQLNNSEDELDGVIIQIGGYVDSVAGGDEAKILSTGFDTRAAPTATSQPPPPLSALDTTIGDRDGELDASWDTTAGAKSYIIEISEDPPTPTSWKHSGVSTKSRFTIKGLQSGKRHWIGVTPPVKGAGAIRPRRLRHSDCSHRKARLNHETTKNKLALCLPEVVS